MPWLLHTSDNGRGLINNFKWIYEAIISHACAHYRSVNSNFQSTIQGKLSERNDNDLFLKYFANKIYRGADLASNVSQSTVSLCQELAWGILIRTIDKYFPHLRPSSKRGYLEFLFKKMYEENKRLRRTPFNNITITNERVFYGIPGNMDIIIDPRIPLQSGILGLRDFTGNPKCADISSLIFAEKMYVVATSDESNGFPASLLVTGCPYKDFLYDVYYDQGTDLGSGVQRTMRQTLPSSPSNLIPNYKFDAIREASGPEEWGFYDVGNTWGPNRPVYYKTYHEFNANCLRINAPFTDRMFVRIRGRLEPYSVYFLVFYAYINGNVPTDVTLHMEMKKVVGNPSIQDPSPNFYNSYAEFPVRPTNKVWYNYNIINPNLSNQFVYIPIITDGSANESDYRLEFYVSNPTNNSWNTNSFIEVTKFGLYKAEQIYEMGPYALFLGEKQIGDQTRYVKTGCKYEVNIDFAVDNTYNHGTKYEYLTWRVFNYLFDLRNYNLQPPYCDDNEDPIHKNNTPS